MRILGISICTLLFCSMIFAGCNNAPEGDPKFKKKPADKSVYEKQKGAMQKAPAM